MKLLLEAFLQQFVAVGAQSEAWRREAVQAGLLSAMHGCLMKLLLLVKGGDAAAALPDDTLTALYQAVIKHF